jgi:threonylcarbamoyladenosine tRNA methylthiotransferase MtaB
LARVASRSDSISHVIEQANEIAKSGVKEIVLTGVNLGDFGIRDGIREDKFFDLIQSLDHVEGIDRIRISSIEPNLLSNEIIEFVSQSKKFVPHFHIPLQSGCNKVLALMRRRYKRELYAERVAHIKNLMPNCCIGVDVIVGFPGETQEDFLETYNFLNELEVSYLHVFTYSERENTPAAEMKGVVPGSTRAERSKMLHILSEKKRHAFYETQVGVSTEVLFEADQKNGFMHGFSRNYVKVKAPYDPLLINEIKTVTLENIASDGDMDISEPSEIFVH